MPAAAYIYDQNLSHKKMSFSSFRTFAKTKLLKQKSSVHSIQCTSQTLKPKSNRSLDRSELVLKRGEKKPEKLALKQTPFKPFEAATEAASQDAVLCHHIQGGRTFQRVVDIPPED